MVQQVTQGIKISVETHYEGTFYKNHKMYFAFRYIINIENQSPDVVQLTDRHWEIKDALNNVEIVEGEGVIGIKPLLYSGQKHMYSSGSILLSPIGAMKGYYSMFNFTSNQKFKVVIPSFKLMAPFALN